MTSDSLHQENPDKYVEGILATAGKSTDAHRVNWTRNRINHVWRMDSRGHRGYTMGDLRAAVLSLYYNRFERDIDVIEDV